MGIIQCSHKCKYQIEGYCTLDKLSTVNSVTTDCPYFTEESIDYGNSLSQGLYSDKFQ